MTRYLCDASALVAILARHTGARTLPVADPVLQMIKPSLMKFLRRGDASAAARQPLIIRHYGARRGTRLQRVDRAALADQPQAQAVRLHVRYTIDAHNYDEVVPPYQIPYRALVVAGLANGFVAGRCFSADGRRWLRRASWPRAAWPARRQRTPPPSPCATGAPSARWTPLPSATGCSPTPATPNTCVPAWSPAQGPATTSTNFALFRTPVGQVRLR